MPAGAAASGQNGGHLGGAAYSTGGAAGALALVSSGPFRLGLGALRLRSRLCLRRMRSEVAFPFIFGDLSLGAVAVVCHRCLAWRTGEM